MRQLAGQSESAKLLTAAEAARRLGMSRTTFYALADRLQARGLRYVAASIDRIIAKALKTENDKGALLC